MIERLKNFLYFPLAGYFRFFAAIKLRRWDPRVIVVTGSNGKTTLLHMLESQIGEQAVYSHHANSSYGVPFDILGLHRKSLQASEWFALFLKAPGLAFSKPPKEKIYVVEADADRPGEGKFLAELLRPEVVLWVSVSGTHSQNFDVLVSQGMFKTVDEAIAYEYGWFLEKCSDLVVLNGDLPLEMQETNRTKAKVVSVTKKAYLKNYEINRKGTTFHMQNYTFTFTALVPEEITYAIAMSREILEYLQLPFDPKFTHFILPPGRGSVFAGIKETMLIDSSYNGNLASINAMLSMFATIPVKKKWVVLGDMLELGEEEKKAHEELAETLAQMDFEKIILIGKRMGEYTFPSLRAKAKRSARDRDAVVSFISQKQALEYLLEHITGGETILFKGSQSLLLEGIIEALLKDKEDAKRLPRREIAWQKRRSMLYTKF